MIYTGMYNIIYIYILKYNLFKPQTTVFGKTMLKSGTCSFGSSCMASQDKAAALYL